MGDIAKQTQTAREMLTATNLRRLAACSLGVLATLGAKPESANARFETAMLPDPLERNVPTAQASAKEDSDKRCTWITDEPSGHYMGLACAGDDGEKDDQFIKLHNSYSREYDFGVIILKGVQKCGWVKAGILKARKPRVPQPACLEYYQTLKDRYTIGTDFNCGVAESGKSKCVDGTSNTPVTEDCDDKTVYRNYATKEKSPLNLHPNGNSGFSDPAEEKIGERINYRYEVRGNSEDGKAVVARGKNAPWGFIREECPHEGYTKGGTRRDKDTKPGRRPNRGE